MTMGAIMVDPVLMVAAGNVLKVWEAEREARIRAMERDCVRLDKRMQERLASWAREATRALNARAYDRFQWFKLIVVSTALGILISMA